MFCRKKFLHYILKVYCVNFMEYIFIQKFSKETLILAYGNLYLYGFAGIVSFVSLHLLNFFYVKSSIELPFSNRAV